MITETPRSKITHGPKGVGWVGGGCKCPRPRKTRRDPLNGGGPHHKGVKDEKRIGWIKKMKVSTTNRATVVERSSVSINR